MDTVRVGVSIGDMNGVGMEVIIKTFSDARMVDNIIPVVYGNSGIANFYKKGLKIQNLSFQKVKGAENSKAGKINIIEVVDGDIKLDVGQSTAEAGEVAFKSLESATSDLASGKIDVLVTAPINKKNIQNEDFDFPGHTEYLTSYSNADSSLMFMVKDDLRVGVATNHIPLKDIAEALSGDTIIEKLKLMNSSLSRDFGIRKPKIAVLGLNPHAGENGMLGDEEKEIIIPAIKKANEEKILCFGPYPSDGFFGSGQFKNFDGVLAMYHDQGLTPFKALAGGTGVNYTAGLPIVRTSPDHGTAYDIAGKGEASETSFRNAVLLASDIFRSRTLEKEITSDVLQIKERENKRRGRDRDNRDHNRPKPAQEKS